LAVSFIITLVYAFLARNQGESFERTRRLSFITLNILNLQFVIGIILYFISPMVIFSSLSMKSPITRFFLVEHITAMLIAVALISIGYSLSKKALGERKKHDRILIYYIIGFLIILAAIPWPFYNLGTNWL
jgi:uncharacterized membrane protein YadS